MSDQPTYVLILKPEQRRRGGGLHVEPIIRLRQLLKLALRGFGMRCLDVREMPASEPVRELCPACAVKVGAAEVSASRESSKTSERLRHSNAEAVSDVQATSVPFDDSNAPACDPAAARGILGAGRSNSGGDVRQPRKCCAASRWQA
jgi:hypothetical protein